VGGRPDLAASGVLAERLLLCGTRGATACSSELGGRRARFRCAAVCLAGWLSWAIAWGLRALFASFTSRSAAPSDSDPRAVQILSAQRARARRFDAVFVLGLVEGEFPGLSEAPSLLSSGQRASLDKVAGGLFPPDAQPERTLFLECHHTGMASSVPERQRRRGRWGRGGAFALLDGGKSSSGRRGNEHESRTLADQVFAVESAPSLRHYLRACVSEGRTPHASTAGAPGAGGTTEMPATRTRRLPGAARRCV